MKLLNKKLAIVSTSVLFSCGAAAAVVSSDLHINSVATSSYNDFKNGNGDDPFSVIDSGYRSRYAEEMGENVIGQKAEIVESFISSKDYDVFSKVYELSQSESESLSSIYESHFDEDGKFDAASYAESYEAHMASKRVARNESLDNRYLGVIGAFSNGEELSSGYKVNINNDIGDAQVNLIEAMNSATFDKKTSLHGILSDATDRLSAYADLATDTQALAIQYADCGSACAFPEAAPAPIDPVEPTPEPEPPAEIEPIVNPCANFVPLPGYNYGDLTRCR